MQDQKVEQALRASELIVKHIKGTLTDDEQAELDLWIGESQENQKMFDELTNTNYMRLELNELDKVDVQAAHSRMQEELFPPNRVLLFIKRYAAAAIIILILGASGFWYWKKNSEAKYDGTPMFVQKTAADIQPGTQKARLVLANGAMVDLNNTDSTFSTEAGTQITNSKGRLSYKGATGNDEAAHHTIIVPKGADYQLWLDDGTRVWMNASSSLYFPAKFTGNNRTVILTGEAYFQVAEDMSRPFHVKVNNLDVMVTGTEFNINSYSDEALIKSTLFKGGVRISNDKISFNLKPGQQLQVDTKGQAKVVNADLEGTAAWKNGVFHLASADVFTVMRQIQRWYNLDQIVFPANFNSESIHISGTMPKSAKLNEVLKLLEANGVVFKYNDNKLVMVPQKD